MEEGGLNVFKKWTKSGNLNDEECITLLRLSLNLNSNMNSFSDYVKKSKITTEMTQLLKEEHPTVRSLAKEVLQKWKKSTENVEKSPKKEKKEGKESKEKKEKNPLSPSPNSEEKKKKEIQQTVTSPSSKSSPSSPFASTSPSSSSSTSPNSVKRDPEEVKKKLNAFDDMFSKSLAPPSITKAPIKTHNDPLKGKRHQMQLVETPNSNSLLPNESSNASSVNNKKPVKQTSYSSKPLSADEIKKKKTLQKMLDGEKKENNANNNNNNENPTSSNLPSPTGEFLFICSISLGFIASHSLLFGLNFESFRG